MNRHVIPESYDGGEVRVVAFDQDARPFADPSAAGRIVLDVSERGMERAEVILTVAEVDELIIALCRVATELSIPQDTRPSAPPVADGRGGGPSELDPAGSACTTIAADEDNRTAHAVTAALARSGGEMGAAGKPVAWTYGCLRFRPGVCPHPAHRIRDASWMAMCLDCWKYIRVDDGVAATIGCGCWACHRDRVGSAVTS